MSIIPIAAELLRGGIWEGLPLPGPARSRRTDRPYPDISGTLLPAHAFENRCFGADVNRCGEETVKGRAMAAEPSLLLADCVPSDYGEMHPTGTRCQDDLRIDLMGRG